MKFKMKFKIGDHVKIINPNDQPMNEDIHVGMIGTVNSFKAPAAYMIKFPNIEYDRYFSEEFLEPFTPFNILESIKLKDLKSSKLIKWLRHEL